jgi:hypothetical protein
MVINNLDVQRTGRPTRPLEADSPLIVNANAVLSLSVAFQRFQPDSRQRGKVFEFDSRFQTIEFELGSTLNSAERSDPLT